MHSHVSCSLCLIRMCRQSLAHRGLISQLVDGIGVAFYIKRGTLTCLAGAAGEGMSGELVLILHLLRQMHQITRQGGELMHGSLTSSIGVDT